MYSSKEGWEHQQMEATFYKKDGFVDSCNNTMSTFVGEIPQKENVVPSASQCGNANMSPESATDSSLVSRKLSPLEKFGGISCGLCDKGPMLRWNLYKHCREVHMMSNEQIGEVKKEVWKSFKNNDNLRVYDVCGKLLSPSGLWKHKKIVHSQCDARNTIICPNCTQKFRTVEQLATHCNDYHDGNTAQTFAVNTGIFTSRIEFEIWLDNIEHTAYTNYSTRTSRCTPRGREQYMRCKFSGGSGDTVNPEVLKRTYGRSKKVHRDCPAFLNILEDKEGFVHYKYCVGHLGHKLTSVALRLPARDEEYIVELLRLGLTAPIIVSKIRKERWDVTKENDKQERICYVSLKDVGEIAEKNFLIGGRTSRNDVESLLELLRSRDDIVVYTYDPARSTGDGFLLAFITCSGKKYLEKFGSKGLIIDDTFDVTKYTLRLATLHVVDDAGVGFPVAFLLSQKMSSLELRELFLLVKGIVPYLDPQFMMTDDTNSFYNAFHDVFPLSKAQKLLCSFHVSQSVERTLRKHFTNKEATIVAAVFRHMLRKPLTATFEESYTEFLTWLSKENPAIHKYMRQYYSERKSEWAACYRLRSPFQTSNHAEAFHPALKHQVLRRKQNNRLDHFVFALLEYVKELEIKHISESSISGTQRNYQNIWKEFTKHKAPQRELLCYTGRQHMIRYADKVWTVQSKTRENVIYQVTIGDCDCDEENNSHCERCGACGFKMTCTCADSVLAGVACVHCHAVATFSVEARNLLPVPRHRLYASTVWMDPPSLGAYEDAEEIPSITSSCNPSTVFMAHQPGSDLYEDAEVNAPGPSTMSLLSPVDLHDRAKEEFNQLDAVVARMYEKMRKSLKNDEPERIQIMREAIEKKIEEVYSCDSNVTLIRRASMQKEGRKPKAASIQAFKTKRRILCEKND